MKKMRVETGVIVKVRMKSKSYNSVLVAFGEISTFAGALFGVDYSYKLKINN